MESESIVRDVAKGSSTYGHYVAWVGRFEDILAGKPGDYRIKLVHNTLRKTSDKPGQGNVDCGYSDLELLPDGTIIATTYLKYDEGPEKHSVMNTRFTLAEIDVLAGKKRTVFATENTEIAGQQSLCASQRLCALCVFNFSKCQVGLRFVGK